MILYENVTLIVTTCNLVEKKIIKCEKFWPDYKSSDNGFENLLDKYTTVI